MFQDVLVLLDGSTEAEMVIPYALEIGSRFDAELNVVAASDSREVSADKAFSLYARCVAGEISDVIHLKWPESARRLHAESLVGQWPDAMITYVEGRSSALTMLACPTIGRKQSLMSIFAGTLLKSTTKPAMIVKRAAEQADEAQKSVIKRILVPLDGSRVGEAALPYAEALAAAFQAEMVLFRVADSPAGWSTTEGPNINWAEARAEQEDKKWTDGAREMEDLRTRLRGKGLDVSAVVFPPADPAKEIIRYAAENFVDLIAMSTHGRSGIRKLVLGSVIEGVLRETEKPILAVRAAGP